MPITVERLYRVTIGETAHLLDGDNALSLAQGIVTALGIDGRSRTDGTDRPSNGTSLAAAVAPPAQLPSGPVPDGEASARPHGQDGKADRPWSADDKATLEELYTTNVPVAEIAAALGRDVGRIRYMTGYLGLHRTRADDPPAVPRFARKASAGSVWNDEDDAFLCDERAKGKSWSLIGELLGRAAGECKARHGDLRPVVRA